MSNPMSNRVQELVDQALTLTDDERAEIVERLMESLPPNLDFDAEWGDEIDRRIADIEAGRTKLEPLDDAIAMALAAIR